MLFRSLFDGASPPPEGNASPDAEPHDCFPCRGEDRWCVIAVATEAQWAGLCNTIGREALRHDPRFASLAARREHRSVLYPLLAQWTSALDAHEAMERLQSAGVPCGVVQNGEDLCNDPHLRSRDFAVAMQHPVAGRLMFPGAPFRMSATPGRPEDRKSVV